ncbi:MAG TPA: RNA-binding cell elongation regulator Jag/EloR [Actinomycetota bacterium]|nr:RNA-binding cell elongation regulator Jag/EloR [Actinomycetota bacterium]
MSEGRTEATEATDQDRTEATDQDHAEAPGTDATPESTHAGGEPDRARAEDVAPEEIARVAGEFVEGLLGAMGLQGEVETSVADGRASVEVNGDDLGILIGRRGQTLEAVQELTRTAVQRRLRAHVRLLVDVESYRARRRESLAEYAREMADRAKERGTEIELEPMNAYERKIVHDAVADIDGVSSFSEGEDPQRKVIVRGE